MLVAVASLIIAASVAIGAWRVAALESRELEVSSQPVLVGRLASEESVELARADLDADEEALFEVCASTPLTPEAWLDALELAAWAPETERLLVRTRLDRATLDAARVWDEGTCLTVGRGRVPAAATYAVVAVPGSRPLPPAASRTTLTARIVVTSSLTALDYGLVAALLLGTLLLVGALGVMGQPSTTIAPVRELGALVRLVAGLGLVLAAGFALSRLPLWGSTLGLVRGLALATVEIAVVIALVVRPRDGTTRAAALGFARPARAMWLALLAAPLVGGALAGIAQLVVALVPTTGVAPIEEMVSWPSGTLSFAIVAMVVPAVEEVFFRGFVFGAVERLSGRWVACAITTLVFVGAHAPQAWGAWGGLAAIAITGLTLGVLRATTRTVVIGAIAHLLYNAALTALQLAG